MAQDKIQIAYYGIGGIGGFYAYCLSKLENVELTVFCRSNYDIVMYSMAGAAVVSAFCWFFLNPDRRAG